MAGFTAASDVDQNYNENYTTSDTGFNINSTTTTISSMTVEVKEPPGLMDFMFSVLEILLRHKFGIKLEYFIN